MHEKHLVEFPEGYSFRKRYILGPDLGANQNRWVARGRGGSIRAFCPCRRGADTFPEKQGKLGHIHNW